jgi:hypothetical protein
VTAAVLAVAMAHLLKYQHQLASGRDEAARCDGSVFGAESLYAAPGFLEPDAAIER